MNYAFGCINVANNNYCVITFALFVKRKEQLHPSYPSIVCFTRLLFPSIYITKTKVALSRFDLYNKMKTLFAVFILLFHLFRHFRTDTGNYIFAPGIAGILMCRYCVHAHQWMFVAHSLCIHWVPMTSWWRLSWNQLNRSEVVCPLFPFLFIN